MSRVLAGFPDGRADEGVGAGPATLEGLTSTTGARAGLMAPERPRSSILLAQAPRRTRRQGSDMTTLTPILSKFWDHPQSWTLETYEENDGYRALDKAFGMGRPRWCRWPRTPGSGAVAARASRPG
jgi:hypothetical protein